MSEIKFEDFLLFIEAKSKGLAKRVKEDSSRYPDRTLSEELETVRLAEVKNLKENNFFKTLPYDEQHEVLELVNSIFNVNSENNTNMEMESKVEKFGKIAQEMVDTYTKKNHDYGDSFGESIKKYGPIAGLVRMSDKWNRLNSLVMGGEAMVKGESIVDTLTDLACYAVMLRMEMESQG